MPHERFYFDGPLEAQISLEGPECHHLLRVCRAQIGDEVELIDGRGSLASARLVSTSKESAKLSILNRISEPRPPCSTILGISLMRMNRFEWLVEKAVELGADALYMFPADGSEKEDLSSNQLQRLRHLTVAAMKQCGRLYLPEMSVYSSLSALIDLQIPLYFGDTDPNAPLLLKTPIPNRLLFLTGPEKGFSTSETALLKQNGHPVKLHTDILRAETAPLAALSILAQMRLAQS